MRVTDITWRVTQGYCQLAAKIHTEALDERSFQLWYRFPAEYEKLLDPAAGDPFLAAVLLPAMVAGESIEMSAPVSPKLLEAVSTIQDIYQSWHPDLHRVMIHAPVGEVREERGGLEQASAACFFSGGVDSFYTLLKHTKDKKVYKASPILSHMILVRGFDIPVDSEHDALFEETLSTAQAVARSINKQVFPVATNLREFLDEFVDWGALGHGAALASVGLVLQSLLSELYIASSRDFAHLPPWGSHPLLDPLWSTESLTFFHDGCEATRLSKMSFIAEYPIVYDNLRVCYQINNSTSTGQLNCGQCEKCLRTMIGLTIAGALEKCTVLPHTIDLKTVAQMSVIPPAITLKELYFALGSSEIDQQIKLAIKSAFEKSNVAFEEKGLKGRSGITYTYKQILRRLANDIEALVPPNEHFLFVDENQLTLKKSVSERAIPFCEKKGHYWGPPADDASAIQEIERQRTNGATRIIFAWPAFWWLDYYTGMHAYLEANFEVLMKNDRVIAFGFHSKK